MNRHPLIDPAIVDDLDLAVAGDEPDCGEWSVSEWLILLSGIAIIFAIYIKATGGLPL